MEFINVSALNESVSATIKTMVADLLVQEHVLSALTTSAAEILKAQITDAVVHRNLQPLLERAIEEYVSANASGLLAKTVGDATITKDIDRYIVFAVQHEVQQYISELIQAPEWVGSVRQILVHEMTSKVLSTLSLIDVDGTIRSEVQKYIRARHEKELPNLGVVDRATSNQLVVTDSGITLSSAVATDLAATNLSATQATFENLTVTGDLAYNFKPVIEQSFADIAVGIADQVASIARKVADDTLREFRVDAADVQLQRSPLIQDSTLSRHVLKSSLTTVGELEQLTVRGPLKSTNNTFTVTNRRVGVNTEAPEYALSVWDEDVSVGLGKFSAGRAYVGTTRAHSLVIGVNRQQVLEVTESQVSVPRLQIDKNSVIFTNAAPTASGRRGDWAWNSEVTDSSPYAWICLGGARWKALR